MAFSISIIAIAAFLSGAVTGIFAVLIAGIRSDDRAKNLTSPSRSRAETVTRRLLGVGVRDTGSGCGHHEEP